MTDEYDDACHILATLDTDYQVHRTYLSDYQLHLVVASAFRKPVLTGVGGCLADALHVQATGHEGTGFSAMALAMGDALQAYEGRNPGAILDADDTNPPTWMARGYDARRYAQPLQPYLWYVGPKERGATAERFNLGWQEGSLASRTRLGDSAPNPEAVLDLLADHYRMNGCAFADAILLRRVYLGFLKQHGA